jgi:hypothetical protein
MLYQPMTLLIPAIASSLIGWATLPKRNIESIPTPYAAHTIVWLASTTPSTSKLAITITGGRCNVAVMLPRHHHPIVRAPVDR